MSSPSNKSTTNATRDTPKAENAGNARTVPITFRARLATEKEARSPYGFLHLLIELNARVKRRYLASKAETINGWLILHRLSKILFVLTEKLVAAYPEEAINEALDIYVKTLLENFQTLFPSASLQPDAYYMSVLNLMLKDLARTEQMYADYMYRGGRRYSRKVARKSRRARTCKK